MVEVGAGGTSQARFERDVISDTLAIRLRQLETGSAALVFGRIDHDDDNGGDSFYIGRLGVWDADQDPVVVDWRAPISESFYRATASDPMGLERRRHFATRGRELLGIDDELFGDLSRFDGEAADGSRLKGEGALIRALETARTGRLGDIVATIQGEQDEVIRAALPGVVVVQGGPGTGKTVVALHRAAYLLYSHRFPLAGQGVLVVGPNRLFLAYIEQVLPSLGEAGVQMATLGDLVVPDAIVEGVDPQPIAHLKGDLVMVDVLRRALRQRQRPLREDIVLGYGLQRLRLTVEQSADIVTQARRRFRTHNAARAFVKSEVFAALATSARDEVSAETVRERSRHLPEVREALEWMWPVLTPAQLLHDFLGARALLRAAGGTDVAPERMETLHRPWSSAEDVRWSTADAPLLDECRALLGFRPGRRDEDEVRTYGHIVVDEAQDLSPMELRMLDRRSLNGSMTIVGDIAQATGAWAHDDWEGVLEHIDQKRPSRRVELTIGYRIPAPLMDVAARALRVAAPDLAPARSIREDGDPPRLLEVPAESDLGEAVVSATRYELDRIEHGNVAIIVPASLVVTVSDALDRAGVKYGRATRSGLDQKVTVVPVGLVKGLEVDAAMVVEPDRIVGEEPQGDRSLYVALTRATRRLTIIHQQPLPPALS
ncbi:MAG: AAA family ATPase [Acidimicrobiia bacterium]|nr:AAA family ATPase [Acidimicrobiia bacterium]MDH5237311.1 AAA family ATPase [Acidimicrobiia bacterium]